MTDPEVAELRSRLEMLEARQVQRYGATDIPHRADTIRQAGPFDYDPRHSERYVAAVMANASPAQLASIEAEVQREIDSRPHPGPVTQAEIRARERREQAAGQADLLAVSNAMMMPPMRPGATVSMSGGQMSVSESAPVCCTAGHPRPSPGDLFCSACGGRFRTAEEQRRDEEQRQAEAMREEAAAAARIAALQDGAPLLTTQPKRTSRKASV